MNVGCTVNRQVGPIRTAASRSAAAAGLQPVSQSDFRRHGALDGACRPMHYQHSLARDRGCTRPGCTVAGANCQVHHAVSDWADDGQTNVDDLTLACPKDGRTEWIPPPHLDAGQSRSTTNTTRRTTYCPTKATSRSPRLGATGRDHHRLLNQRRAIDHVWLPRQRTASPWLSWPAR